jgi:DNA polymerase
VHILHRDYETRSRADLKKVGGQRYAADPTTEVLICRYAVDHAPVERWAPGDPIPLPFVLAAQNPDWLIVAHNDSFETAVEKFIMRPRYKWPLTPIERHRCTMAQCLALGLPAALGAAAAALALTHRKDEAGERLMHQMCKPRRPRKGEDPDGVYWFDDPERLARLSSYCAQDVEVERELYHQLPPLSEAEQKIWELTHRINVRGFHIDRNLAEAARRIAEDAAPLIDQELTELTGGAVTTINQVARLLEWVQSQDCQLQNLQREEIEELLQNELVELTAPVRQVLELRLSGAQAAAKKITAFLARAGADDRVRGGFQYHGAGTGRWSSTGVQIQNLKHADVEDVDAAIAAISTGSYAHVKALYPRPLAIIGDCIRPILSAASGHVLVGADYSAIESRVLAWAAGEQSKIDDYVGFDETQDPRDEPYCITACKIFDKPNGTFTKSDPERDVGKTADLALGYAGGIRAWRNFSDAFTDDEVKAFIREWRRAHPAIVKYWDRLDRAAWTAVKQRGITTRCGVVRFRCTDAFLKLILPSGRIVSYPQPRIIGDDREQHVVFMDNTRGRFIDCRNGFGAYGGLWCENVVQAIARDLLADAMLRLEAAGFPIVLHVHDEAVAEVPAGTDRTEEFTTIMTAKPTWAEGLPIAAKAWSGTRYSKA